jgi:phosphate transport system substrate-binding protein
VTPNEIPIAHDGIAVIVNPSNPLSEISVEKLSDIYSGKAKSWSDVGAKGLGDIQAISRDPSSGTYDSFKEMVIQKPDKTRDYAASCVQTASNEAVLTTVGQTKGAIGYIGLAYVNDKVKVLGVIPLGGGKPAVKPSESTVRDNSYPISRLLYLYTDGVPAGNVKTYIDWGLSDEGQKIVKEVGYITLK